MKMTTRILLGCAALMLSSATVVAADAIYVPLGSDDAIVSIDPTRDAVAGRIEGVSAAHGLAATPDGKYLIVGSYKERPASDAAPPKPALVSEEDHAAHHTEAPDDTQKSSAVVSTVSVLDVKDKSIIRRIDVPGAVSWRSLAPIVTFAIRSTSVSFL